MLDSQGLRSRSRMAQIQTPIIPLVGELIAQNPGTISLGQGVVSYAPPETSMTALQEFWQDSQQHKYQPVVGIPQLREAIATKLQRDNQISIGADNAVVVTAGSNMAFLNAILAITQPEDEIILNTPYYFNHEMAIAMINCRPVLVETDANYQPRLEALAQAITPRTRAIVTISPNNPTGAVYPRETLLAINQLCREAGIYHISDEAYEYFTYDGVTHVSPGSFPASQSHTISLFSLSKSYGFASWRIGYMVIPQNLLLAVQKVQDTNLICPPVISQYAATGALSTPIDYLRDRITDLAQVRNIVRGQLQQLPPNCQVPQAQGAFYFFIKVATQLSDLELVTKLIEQYKVAVIPGSTFGLTSGCYLRVAYGALTESNARAGVARLLEGLRELS